jgi:hypothetical protein
MDAWWHSGRGHRPYPRWRQGDDPINFTPDQVYGTTRITMPILILAGLVLEIFAISETKA